MPSLLLTPPAGEPVALDAMKAFLRVETGDDDNIVAALIAGARVHVENWTRRALMTQTWRLILHLWPEDGRIAVVPAPLQSLTAARVYNADGTTHSIDAQAFVLDLADSSLLFTPWTLPAPARPVAGIELDVIVGYGDASAVPEPFKQALRLLVAHWYEHRALVADGSNAALPQSVAALLAPYRVLSL
jgi:uncharacterized phiE125 gp8 family phage protein